VKPSVSVKIVLLLAIALPAVAAASGADGAASDWKLYRYVERTTCYTIITNRTPDRHDVEFNLPPGRYKPRHYYCIPRQSPAHVSRASS
jgi:hypothetical protein